MNEFISKNRIFDLIHAVNRVHGFTSYDDYVRLLKDVEKSTNAGVQPVKHGRWICTNDYETLAYDTLYYNRCSACGEESLETGDFCPNCGAKMLKDGEQNE